MTKPQHFPSQCNVFPQVLLLSYLVTYNITATPVSYYLVTYNITATPVSYHQVTYTITATPVSYYTTISAVFSSYTLDGYVSLQSVQCFPLIHWMVMSPYNQCSVFLLPVDGYVSLQSVQCFPLIHWMVMSPYNQCSVFLLYTGWLCLPALKRLMTMFLLAAFKDALLITFHNISINTSRLKSDVTLCWAMSQTSP